MNLDGFSTSFDRLQTEHPQAGNSSGWSFWDKRKMIKIEDRSLHQPNAWSMVGGYSVLRETLNLEPFKPHLPP
jgi:hypothetical protein